MTMHMYIVVFSFRLIQQWIDIICACAEYAYLIQFFSACHVFAAWFVDINKKHCL
jgi:hypothetical protein